MGVMVPSGKNLDAVEEQQADIIGFPGSCAIPRRNDSFAK
jgi:cobalamin-dependent methionine synthase I